MSSVSFSGACLFSWDKPHVGDLQPWLRYVRRGSWKKCNWSFTMGEKYPQNEVDQGEKYNSDAKTGETLNQSYNNLNVLSRIGVPDRSQPWRTGLSAARGVLVHGRRQQAPWRCCGRDSGCPRLPHPLSLFCTGTLQAPQSPSSAKVAGGRTVSVTVSEGPYEKAKPPGTDKVCGGL